MAKALERTDDLARQLTARQESLATALDHRADQTLAEIKRLRQRRQELAGVKGGPIDTAAQAIQMTQLMADEMLVLLDHVAWSQRGMAQALKPLEVQREVLGTGGSGASDEAPNGGAGQGQKPGTR
ncbi:hypothetical protein JQX13_26380 [Archangium violaceum]|uniref:hypothetical protein n=1 Tax=Archangium violaceum TaxID=83451 RepID=UPI00193BD942|nr:hypothetical protein [Archangium violaceum]QRK13247.1 hypothetical protein JQX13_26380 [Archangium violaceum]